MIFRLTASVCKDRRFVRGPFLWGVELEQRRGDDDAERLVAHDADFGLDEPREVARDERLKRPRLREEHGRSAREVALDVRRGVVAREPDHRLEGDAPHFLPDRRAPHARPDRPEQDRALGRALEPQRLDLGGLGARQRRGPRAPATMGAQRRVLVTRQIQRGVAAGIIYKNNKNTSG
jgi:hypothetical protein